MREIRRPLSSLLRIGTAMTIVVAFSAPAISQTGQGVLDAFPATPVGEISGMPAWSVEGSDMVWMQTEDGHVIAGYVFDQTGADVGSALVGVDPVSVWESFEIPAPASTPPAEVTQPGSLSWSEMIGGGSPSGSPIVIEQGEASPSLDDASVDETTKIAADALSVIKTTLTDVPESEKAALIEELMLMIGASTSPEELQLGIVRWTEKVTGEAILPEDFKIPETQGVTSPATEAPVEDDVKPFRPAEILPERSATEAPAPVSIVEAATLPDRENPTAESFLDDIRVNGFWFAMGYYDAPVAYMIADPACPYCARSIANLKGDIEAGRLQLRVLMAPFVSSRSPSMIAGILFSGDPAGAYFTHSLSYAEKGASDLALHDFADLPENVVNAVKGNYDMVVDYKLNGVPFFAWNTAAGPKFLAGVPEAGRFADATRDAFDGTRR
jgi:hypothetical protein